MCQLRFLSLLLTGRDPPQFAVLGYAATAGDLKPRRVNQQLLRLPGSDDVEPVLSLLSGFRVGDDNVGTTPMCSQRHLPEV